MDYLQEGNRDLRASSARYSRDQIAGLVESPKNKSLRGDSFDQRRNRGNSGRRGTQNS